MTDEPIARVVLPRWVRVLAFLRVPFAVRRVRAKRYLDWFILMNQDAILAKAREDFYSMLINGSVETTLPCDSCGDGPARRFIRDGVKCENCYGAIPKFYGRGIAYCLAPPQCAIDKAQEDAVSVTLKKEKN